MSEFRALTTVEQLVKHLRDEILRGAFGHVLPGTDTLVKTTATSRKTVVAAVRQLEDEGLVENVGQGHSRRIALPKSHPATALRVGLMLYVEDDRRSDFMLELVYRLQNKGHQVAMTNRTLTGLRMNVQKVARYVRDMSADAWVVGSGSGPVLQWFSEQETPAFALFGRHPSVDIAATGPMKSPAMKALARRLVELGHRKIVLLTREERRKPTCGRVERVFLDELRALGVEIGPYNLPDWEVSPAGLARCLSSLFRYTPPTAFVAQQVDIFDGVTHFLLGEGIRVPRDVSTICADPSSSFSLCTPTVAHIAYDSRRWVNHILRWVDKVAQGVNDRRQVLYPAEFVDGGSLGPVAESGGRIALD